MTWGKRRALVIASVILVFVLLVWAAARPSRITISKSVLIIDAQGDIGEQRSTNLLSAFGGGPTPVLHDYLDAIDAARNDSRITGIVVRMGSLDTGWAKLEE